MLQCKQDPRQWWPLCSEVGRWGEIQWQVGWGRNKSTQDTRHSKPTFIETCYLSENTIHCHFRGFKLTCPRVILAHFSSIKYSVRKGSEGLNSLRRPYSPNAKVVRSHDSIIVLLWLYSHVILDEFLALVCNHSFCLTGGRHAFLNVYQSITAVLFYYLQYAATSWAFSLDIAQSY